MGWPMKSLIFQSQASLNYFNGTKCWPNPMDIIRICEKGYAVDQSRHQAITWTNFGLLSVRSIENHLRAISNEIPQQSVIKISFRITCPKLYSNLSGVYEFTHKTSKHLDTNLRHFHPSGCPAMSPHKIPWHFPDHFEVFPDHETYHQHFITALLTLILQAIWQITHQK